MLGKMTDRNGRKKGCVLLTAALLAASLAACGGTPMSYSAGDTKNMAAAAPIEEAAAADEYISNDSGAGMAYEITYEQEAGMVEEPEAEPSQVDGEIGRAHV